MKVHGICAFNSAKTQAAACFVRPEALVYPCKTGTGKYQALYVNTYAPAVANIFENYDSAQKIFRKNLEEGKGIFGTPENADKIINNENIRKNAVKFFAQYSREEIKKLDNKKILTIDEVRY